MRAGSITFPLFSQLFALALVFLSITPTRATGGLFDLFDDLFDILNPPRNSQPLKNTATACDCLDSISLPGFNGFLDANDINKNKDIDLDLTYNVAKCKKRAITVKLLEKKNNAWKAGCCKNDREGLNLAVDLFYGYDGKNSELDLSIYLGGGPGKNTCNKKPKEICTADAIKKGTIFLFEIAVDGCSRTKKVEFKCMASLPDASQKKRMESRNEAALGLPPRHFRCPNQGRACRLDGPGNRWECIMENDIEACGGCPGTAEAQDCTDLPGVSAVQCLNKQCVVAKCLRGHSLVGNECVRDAGLLKQQAAYTLSA